MKFYHIKKKISPILDSNQMSWNSLFSFVVQYLFPSEKKSLKDIFKTMRNKLWKLFVDYALLFTIIHSSKYSFCFYIIEIEILIYIYYSVYNFTNIKHGDVLTNAINLSDRQRIHTVSHSGFFCKVWMSSSSIFNLKACLSLLHLS